MKTLDFEWKILEWFDSFKSDFLNIFNQYISLILGSIGLIVILMIVYWVLNKEKGLLRKQITFLFMLMITFQIFLCVMILRLQIYLMN